jgi:hypothetical protein
MPDNYIEFTTSIPLATPAECEWVETLFADPPKVLRPDWCGEDDLDLEFDWAIEVEGDSHLLVLFTTNGHFDTDKVEEFFRLFLTESPTKLTKVGAEFCYRSEGAEVGAFGGSAVFCEKGEDGHVKTEWLTTGGWLEAKLASS